MIGISKYIILVLIVIAGIEGFLIYHYRMQAITYQLQVAQITSGIDVAAEKQAVKQNVVDQTAVVTKLTQANADLQKQLENINAINNTPASDDGKVAVVLGNALARLRFAPARH